jgi:hypothetical protein
MLTTIGAKIIKPNAVNLPDKTKAPAIASVILSSGKKYPVAASAPIKFWAAKGRVSRGISVIKKYETPLNKNRNPKRILKVWLKYLQNLFFFILKKLKNYF